MITRNDAVVIKQMENKMEQCRSDALIITTKLQDMAAGKSDGLKLEAPFVTTLDLLLYAADNKRLTRLMPGVWGFVQAVIHRGTPCTMIGILALNDGRMEDFGKFTCFVADYLCQPYEPIKTQWFDCLSGFRQLKRDEVLELMSRLPVQIRNRVREANTRNGKVTLFAFADVEGFYTPGSK